MPKKIIKTTFLLAGSSAGLSGINNTAATHGQQALSNMSAQLPAIGSLKSTKMLMTEAKRLKKFKF